MAGTYLEQFLESIQTLPCELKRNLILIRELDGKVDGLIKSINCESDEYINSAHELTSNDKCERYTQILGLFDKAQLYTDDKKELAHQTYNIIDKHIRRLDTELAKFDELDDRRESIKDSLCENNNNKKKGLKTIKEKSNISSNKAVLKSDLEKNARSKTVETKLNPHLAKNDENLPKSELCMDMDIDPNEPLYCICQQVSFGEMVGCDDTDCPIEWFHFQCVGLACKPKGKWYCEQCTLKRKNKQA